MSLHFHESAQAPQLWLLLAFTNDELMGYLALKRTRRKVLGLLVAKLDLLTAHLADRPHLVARAEHELAVSASFFEYLLRRGDDWCLLELQQQEATSPLRLTPPEASRGRLCRREWPNMSTGTVSLRWNTAADYFAALSKKARSNVSRQMRTLLAAGHVELLSSADPQTCLVLFELYRQIELHSWKTTAGGAIGNDPERLAHMLGLMAPEQAMRVQVQVLLLDGIPIAGLITASFCEGLYALHIVYDDRAAVLAPGSAIFWMGMRRAIEKRYRFFDLQWGFDYYKTRWLATMSETRSVQIYRVDKPWFWRRVMGDLRRRYFGGASDADTMLCNPLRHSAGKANETSALNTSTLATAEQRARFALLIDQVHCGPGEYLAGAELGAMMPFETSRSVR